MSSTFFDFFEDGIRNILKENDAGTTIVSDHDQSGVFEQFPYIFRATDHRIKCFILLLLLPCQATTYFL